VQSPAVTRVATCWRPCLRRLCECALSDWR